jgi:hypothetical protein
MNRFRNAARRWLTLTAGVLASCANPCVAGKGDDVPGGTCFPHIDNCANIPKGAIPQPYGWFVHAWQNAQCAKAEADDFVIYKHEWFKGGAELGPYGTYHIHQILKRLPGVPFPVLIEVETQNPERNEMRRAVIVNYLAQVGVHDPETRVVLGYPEASGIYGDEAPRIYQQMISQQSLFGAFGGMGGGFGGFGGMNTVPGGGTYSGFGGPPIAAPQNLR